MADVSRESSLRLILFPALKEHVVSVPIGLEAKDEASFLSKYLVPLLKDNVDVLKMDCEGAEFEILENLSTDDLKKIKVIGLEYHRCPQPIIQKLECAGFDVKIVNVFNSNQGLLLAVLK